MLFARNCSPWHTQAVAQAEKVFVAADSAFSYLLHLPLPGKEKEGLGEYPPNPVKDLPALGIALLMTFESSTFLTYQKAD